MKPEDENIIIVPQEDRALIVPAEDRTIIVPEELRTIEVRGGDMLLGTKIHTAGNTIRWKIDYGRWLDNAAQIANVNISSSSLTCTIANPAVLGRQIVFFLTGGVANEQVTVTLRMTDSANNIKIDTLQFTVMAP